MALKRQKRNADTDTPRPAKKQKLNEEDDSFDIMANLDLDLNIVVGKDKTPISLNFYSEKMKEIQIDSHVYFQFNPENYAHNILWKSKVLLHKSEYSKYYHLIRKKNSKYCHFHQPSPKQLFEMYKIAPSSLQESESCGTILYNIHKSIMSTISEDSYRRRNRKELQKELTNLNIPNLQHIKFLNMINNKIQTHSDNDDSKINDFLEIDTSSNEKNKHKNTMLFTDVIDDYGFIDNVFHKLSIKYRICPILLIREFLKFNFAITNDTAKLICILLSQKSIATNMSDVKDNIFKLHNVSISIAILNAVFFGVMTDCIRGYNQSIAWCGWNEKVMDSQNQILVDMFKKCMGKGAHFLEHTLIGKFRAIIAKINDKIKHEKDKIKILNESEQKIKIDALKREKIKLYKQMNSGGDDDGDGEELSDYKILMEIGWSDPPTPDLLFSRPVMINGSFVHWMDSKNFLVTYQDKLKHRKIKKQVEKYNKAFGAGAIVCLGFVEHYKKFQRSVMLLDASYWILSM